MMYLQSVKNIMFIFSPLSYMYKRDTQNIKTAKQIMHTNVVWLILLRYYNMFNKHYSKH